MVASARSTLLLSKIVPAYAGPPERYFRSKERSEMDFGRLRWPAWEKDAPRPSPNQSLLSRTAGLVSVLRVTDDCVAEMGGALGAGLGVAWHRVSAKQLPAYLDEMTWRFNNRKNPFLFRDTMLKLIHSENLEYKDLTVLPQLEMEKALVR
jgi:hypothetical protein